jgi:hypothetical protein
MRQNAWLTSAKNAPRVECAMSDISATGARIEVEKPGELPDRFILMFTSSGQPCRWCRVIWRTGRHVGVKFEKMTREEAERLLLRGESAVARSA